MLKLGELLDQPDLGLRLLTGGDVARERSIEGVHNSEMTGPTQFVPGGWMMLTLGIKLRGHANDQRKLIAELDEAQVSALGFGVGVAFEHVPKSLLEEAERRGFPVFEVPYDTAYREIIGFVNRSLLSTDLRLLQRSLSMQSYLMDALRDPRPLDALVQRLSELLDSTVVMFNDQGTVTASSRDAPYAEIWESVSHGKRPSATRAVTQGTETLAIPIDSPGYARLWLVITGRRRKLHRQLLLSMLQTTERLLELIAISQRATSVEERVLRAEVLVAALSRDPDPMALRSRLARFGLSFDTPARILAIEAPGAPSATPLEATHATVDRLLEEHEVPYLTALRESRVIVLAQASAADLRRILGPLLDGGDGALRIGGGRETRDIGELPQSLRDAQVALRNLAVSGADGLLAFEEFDIASWLVGITPRDDLRAKTDLVLGPLLPYPELIETVRTYLRLQMRVSATAQALNLHENSLRYRLTRVESLIGRPLRELSTLFDLYVATLDRDALSPPAAAAAVEA